MRDIYRRQTILVVDDAAENLSLISEMLHELYRVKVASSGEKALRIARDCEQPDLILLDVMMPDIDGYEVCRRLKADQETCDIPVIFLTSLTDIGDEMRGLELGAVDYIFKPISPPIVMARVKTHLILKAASDFLRDKNIYFEREVDRRTKEVSAIQEVTILALASLAETRDADTGKHLQRTQFYVKTLALRLKSNKRFETFLTDENITMLFKSAPLHDIGKVGIPDSILLKPGSLEPEEFEVMKTHTTLGRDALENAEYALGSKVLFLSIAKEICLHHHEKWDGSGYPAGLSGDAIPISARLMAVADVYDALTCRRVYRAGMACEKVLEIIRQGRGVHFDPEIVDAFLELQDEFREITTSFRDNDANLDG